MVRATVKSASGAVITVEGSQREVSKILAAVESTTALGQPRETVAEAKAAKKQGRKRAAASTLVIGLKEEGFFDKPRGLTDIAKTLEQKGYIYPVTTLSGVMLGLVQKKLLGRKKLEGRWVYGR